MLITFHHCYLNFTKKTKQTYNLEFRPMYAKWRPCHPWVKYELLFFYTEVVVLTDLAKLHLETCAEVGVCMLLLKPGEDGIVVVTSLNVDMPCALLLLLLLYQLLSWLKVINFIISRGHQ